MRIDQNTLKKMILSEVKRIIKEERDAAALLSYYKELRSKTKDNAELSPEARKELRDKYNIASITNTEDGKKRVVFKTNPIDVLIPADEEEV